jgi:hypothetical protein
MRRKTTAEEILMLRAVIDDRLRRAWAILIGMSAMAVTVGLVTIYDQRPRSVGWK